MKCEKGVTLTALVAYVMVFMIIISIVSMISTHFYGNLTKVKEPAEYVLEFNKFAMFFITDVKLNNSINSISTTSIEFGDGTKYEYKNSKIYRNNQAICKNVSSFEFTKAEYTKNNYSKTLVNVKAVYGQSENALSRTVDFVLKYW